MKHRMRQFARLPNPNHTPIPACFLQGWVPPPTLAFPGEGLTPEPPPSFSTVCDRPPPPGFPVVPWSWLDRLLPLWILMAVAIGIGLSFIPLMVRLTSCLFQTDLRNIFCIQMRGLLKVFFGPTPPPRPPEGAGDPAAGKPANSPQPTRNPPAPVEMIIHVQLPKLVMA